MIGLTWNILWYNVLFIPSAFGRGHVCNLLLWMRYSYFRNCIWHIAFSLFQQAQKVILSHNASSPLFLYLPFQNVHAPTQAPEEYVNKYDFIEEMTRRKYAAMVDIVDEAIGNVTQTMQKAGWVTGRKLRLDNSFNNWHLQLDNCKTQLPTLC